jgi:hypothetical protein
MRARYYDPTTGSFGSEDRAKDGSNWYAYASQSPTGIVDRDGNFGVSQVSIGVAIGEGFLSAGFDAILQTLMTGSVDWKEVGIAFGIGLVAGGVGHYFRWLHYAKTPLGRRVWQEAAGSFGTYFAKMVGIGTGTSSQTMRLLPLWRSLTSGGGTRFFSFAYNSYVAGYLDD